VTSLDNRQTRVGTTLTAAPAEVLRALNGLRPEHRAVLVELWFRRRTVAEAARDLGVPAETVKSQIFHALRALRLALAEERERSS
jgi:DNA-directed RNA polymerase specialized sigma24 family protein